MLTDVGALGLTLLTAWIARRPADDTKTYGYLRLGDPGRAGQRRRSCSGSRRWWCSRRSSGSGTPAPIQGGLFLAVAVAGLVVNAVALGLLHGDREHSLNTRGAYLHVLGDLLGSVGAIAAALIILFTGWTLADPIVSIAPLAADPGRRLAAGAGEHRHPARGGARATSRWPRCSAGCWRCPGVAGGARPPRLDRHQRHGGHERPRGGARPGRASRVLAGIREELAGLGIGHVTMQLEVGSAMRGEAGGREGGKAARRTRRSGRTGIRRRSRDFTGTRSVPA